MTFSKRNKIRAMLAVLLLLDCLLTACATVPPEPNAAYAPTAKPAQTPEAEEAASDPVPGTVVDIAPDPTSKPSPARPVSTPTLLPVKPPDHVDLFYSGAFSMMGFADAPITTVYEYAMDALPACVSLCWPQAKASFYRYGAGTAKENMRLSKDLLLGHISEPYFYLETEMRSQPARVKPGGRPAVTAEENLNEPIPGFYQAAGLPAPMETGGTGSAGGTASAVLASDPETLTIIVTDLHELRTDDGALLAALNERCLQLDRCIGVAAVASEFSGYVPGIGASGTAFVWGAPPTGTLDYLMEFSDYSLGVSIDPEAREVAMRPFYILCIGEQGAVNTYLRALSDRFTREFAGNSVFKFASAVFGGAYVPADYTIAGNMRYVSGQGVTAIPEEAAPAGVSRVELKASQEARFLEWDVEYGVHSSDPRGPRLTAEDFTFMASATNGGGVETILPHLTWSVLDTAGGTVTLRLRLDLPQGILTQGSYTLRLLGSLAAPGDLPGSDWLGEFGYDADGAQIHDMEQDTLAFDGSRTLFLSRLIDALGKANMNRTGVTPLGMVAIALVVYA